MRKRKSTAVHEEDVEVLPPEDSSSGVRPKNEPKTTLPAESNRGLVPFDSLSAYLREIRRFPKLTREEEHELAVRYRKHQDVDAAYQLVKSNLWLVVRIAKEYQKAAKSLLDIIQEGNIGLMEAVKNFDPYRGVRFPSYAVWWIRAYIIRYVIANFRMVKVGTTQAQRKLFFNLQKEKEKLERAGFYPGPKLLAEKLNVKESEVVEMEQRLGSPDLSVDAPVKGDTDGDLHSILPAKSLSAEELVGRKEFQELLQASLEQFSSTLSEKERLIFDERMLSEEKATLQTLSDKLSISRERVRQIENKIRDKLKLFIEERLGSEPEHLDF